VTTIFFSGRRRGCGASRSVRLPLGRRRPLFRAQYRVPQPVTCPRGFASRDRRRFHRARFMKNRTASGISRTTTNASTKSTTPVSPFSPTDRGSAERSSIRRARQILRIHQAFRAGMRFMIAMRRSRFVARVRIFLIANNLLTMEDLIDYSLSKNRMFLHRQHGGSDGAGSRPHAPTLRWKIAPISWQAAL
jgi:hypothetical protein